MAKRVVQRRNVMTREVLAEELSSLERRMDAKIDSTAESFKEYVDSRRDQLDMRFSESEVRFNKVDERFDRLKGYFEGLVSMVVAQNTRIDKVLIRLEDRNRRINIFESRN